LGEIDHPESSSKTAAKTVWQNPEIYHHWLPFIIRRWMRQHCSDSFLKSHVFCHRYISGQTRSGNHLDLLYRSWLRPLYHLYTFICLLISLLTSPVAFIFPVVDESIMSLFLFGRSNHRFLRTTSTKRHRFPAERSDKRLNSSRGRKFPSFRSALNARIPLYTGTTVSSELPPLLASDHQRSIFQHLFGN
jgi:hypothetical protein